MTSSSSTVTWPASTDNVGVTGYDVYIDDELTTTTSQTTVTLRSLSPATEYAAHIVAFDAAGNRSAPSAPVEFTTLDEPPVEAECAVEFDADPWTSGPGQGGFTAYLTITNTGPDPIDGWTLAFDLPSGHGLDHGWSAVWETTGQSVTATNLTWNRRIAPSSSVGIGFNGTWSGEFSSPEWFELNDEPCSVE